MANGIHQGLSAKAVVCLSIGLLPQPIEKLRFVKPTGTPAEHFWRWKNAEFDRLVDEMGQTAHDDPALLPLFRQAMEIWLRELPSIPILQWYHRIPHNQTYWTNWPSATNPYINSAPWHRTFLLVLLGLEPAQG